MHSPVSGSFTSNDPWSPRVISVLWAIEPTYLKICILIACLICFPGKKVS